MHSRVISFAVAAFRLNNEAGTKFWDLVNQCVELEARPAVYMQQSRRDCSASARLALAVQLSSLSSWRVLLRLKHIKP
jgi:hypothetical protein